jgi:hypothetical protein
MRFSCTKLIAPKYKPIHFHPAWVFTRAKTIGQKTHARRRGIERGGAKTERGGRGRF